MAVARPILFGIAAAGALLLLALYFLGGTLIPFVVAFILAYLLDPFVTALVRLRIPRTVAILLLFAGVVVVMILFAALLLPVIQAQAADLIESLPEYGKKIETELIPFLERTFRIRLPATPREWARELYERLRLIPPQLFPGAAALVQWMFQNVATLVVTLVKIAIIPIVAFYLLKDFDRIKPHLLEYIPPGRRPDVVPVLRDMDRVFAGFFRGQFVLALALAVLYGVGLWIAGLNGAVVLGLITGFGNFIPYVGFVVGITLSLVVALAQFHDLWHVGAVLVIYGIGQVIEQMLLAPKILGGRVGLHPVAVILAILLGGNLFGFIGVVLAVPIAGMIRVLIRRSLERWKASEAYRAGV